MIQIAIGGPAYRLQVDARQVGAVTQLALQMERSKRDVVIAAHDYEHDAILPWAREELLLRQLGDHTLDFFLSLDSDVFPRIDNGLGTSLAEWCHHLKESVIGRDIATVSAVVPQRDGRPNCWAWDPAAITHRGDRLTAALEKPARVFAVGAAFTLHNLAWYRTKMETILLPWYGVTRKNGERHMSEDYWHCDIINRLGGQVWATPGWRVMHAPEIGMEFSR